MSKVDPDQTAIVRLSELTGEDTEDGLRVPTLTVLKGSELGRVVRLLGGRTVLGRSSQVAISMVDEGLSRSHVEFEVGGMDAVTVRDLGSTNGTFLNERRIDHKPRPLQDGDRVRLAATVLLRYALKDPLEESAQQQVYDQSVRDPLTGIFNKRYLAERLEQAFSVADRTARPLSLVIFDLDHFKEVNDRYGHDAGDEVLKQITSAVRRSLRQDELFARYGGEEFVLLLPDTRLEQAVAVAERVRERVAAQEVLSEGHSVKVTASFGVASTQAEGFPTANALFVRADQQLYQAKRAGRDQVSAVKLGD